MTPDDLLRHIARQPRVALRESSLPESIARATGAPPDPAELARNLATLAAAGDVCRWVARGHAVVTLSSVAAYRFRLKLNPSSSRWVDHGEPDPRDRNTARRTAGGAKILCESDMSEEPPGNLANVVDKRTEVEDDPDFGRGRILAEEKLLGLVRPTLPLVGCRPWTPENWERAPDAHVCDPLDDPRANGAAQPPGGPSPPARPRVRRKSADQLRKAPPAGPCPVCNGRELRPMIGLVTRKAGKNRAARPPELVDGGEYCCRCGRIFNEAIWPRVFRIADPAPSVNAGPTATGKATD